MSETSPSELPKTMTPEFSATSSGKLSSTSTSSLARTNLNDIILADTSGSSSNTTTTATSPMNLSTSISSGGGGSGLALNEKVATLASSIYTELEKVIKVHGRDTVKDLMSLVVNILEALDVAYHEKEELTVDNELLKDDYDKLLSQYEREKQHRKDTELKLFQSEDSFAEQKRDYEEKVKSLESIVRMIDLKSKNTSDHVMRLEEKENELKREYNKLHERYTELFKTHCDYMERTKLLFGYDGRVESNTTSQQNNTRSKSKHAHNHQQNNQQQTSNQHQTTSNNNNNNSQQQSNQSNANQMYENSFKQFVELLKSSPNMNLNKSDLINALKQSQRSDVNSVVSAILSTAGQNQDDVVSLRTAASTASLTSLVSNTNQNSNSTTANQTKPGQQLQQQQSNELDQSINGNNNNPENCLGSDEANQLNCSENRINLQSENFDEHLSNNCSEFDDNMLDNQNNNKLPADLDTEYEGEYDGLVKNDLSLFNELSKENYDITELDDGADLTGMTREVANLIRENSELLQTKHALNVLKDDLIVRLDQFSNEMVILREEIRSLQTVKACLQLRITELEEEARKAKEELSVKSRKMEEEDESLPISQRKRFTRAEMARVLMERNQYKERLMDLQEAVRWTEMIRASKADHSSGLGGQLASLQHQQQQSFSDEQQHTSEHHKKRSTLWKFFSDLFGTSQHSQLPTNPNIPQTQQTSPIAQQVQAKPSTQVLSPKSRRNNNTPSSSNQKPHEQVVPLEKEQQMISKAFEFLKETEPKLIVDKKELETVREDGRMQAYGWSLPYKNSPKEASKESVLNISVPVPVYCRPLFQKDTLTQLKLSCANTINYLYDKSYSPENSTIPDIGKNHASCFESIDPDSQTPMYKSSCVWLCNFNENDTHVSILDANKPSDLIKQFTLTDVKVHCMLSVSGVLKSDMEHESRGEIKLKQQSDAIEGDSITYIEFEPKEDEQTVKSGTNLLYPTMWLGSQEGLYGFLILILTSAFFDSFEFKWRNYLFNSLLVHSSITDVEVTLERVKLKDAILCMSQNKCKVVVGLADGSAAVFTRNKAGIWDMRSYYLITFDNSHHSVRCLINVNNGSNIWCGCRNKIYILNSSDLAISSVIEVHPRKENQVRHLAYFNDGVWVSIRLDSTLRLYNSKTYQQLQYLDIEPFITRMLGTSNLGLSLVRVSSLIIASKRLWIGTGNGVILSIPFNDDSSKQNVSKKPGGVVRVNSKGEETTDTSTTFSKAPYCNISDAQFSFHGHRDAVKFFLNVPNLTIQKSSLSTKPDSNSTSTTTNKLSMYEKAETLLVLSGGHGYIDFRIGDTTSGSLAGKMLQTENRGDDIKFGDEDATAGFKKNDRSYLIVWQINNE